MIKNFDEIKQQLGELATIINAFKSEAVQLRIVELILRSGADPAVLKPDEEIEEPVRKQARRRKKNLKAKADGEPEAKLWRRGSAVVGSARMLDALLRRASSRSDRRLARSLSTAVQAKLERSNPMRFQGHWAGLSVMENLNDRRIAMANTSTTSNEKISLGAALGGIPTKFRSRIVKSYLEMKRRYSEARFDLSWTLLA